MDQEYKDALYIAQDQRENSKQVIALRPDLTVFSSGRMSVTAGTAAYYYAGTVVGLATSGANAGFYEVYSSSNTDGSQVPVGVLAEDVSVDSLGNGSEASIIVAGYLFQSYLIGLDSNAISALGGKSLTIHGVSVFKF